MSTLTVTTVPWACLLKRFKRDLKASTCSVIQIGKLMFASVVGMHLSKRRKDLLALAEGPGHMVAWRFWLLRREFVEAELINAVSGPSQGNVGAGSAAAAVLSA